MRVPFLDRLSASDSGGGPRYTAYGRRRIRGEKGYILAMTGLLLIPLIGFTAMAVDVGVLVRAGRQDAAGRRLGRPGRRDLERQQRHADHHGAVDRRARTGSRTASTGSPSRSVIPSGNPSELTVTISAPASLFFSGVFLKNETLTRSATAQYNQPIPMGSPLGQLGNDPDNPDPHRLGIHGRAGPLARRHGLEHPQVRGQPVHLGAPAAWP